MNNLNHIHDINKVRQVLLTSIIRNPHLDKQAERLKQKYLQLAKEIFDDTKSYGQDLIINDLIEKFYTKIIRLHKIYNLSKNYKYDSDSSTLFLSFGDTALFEKTLSYITDQLNKILPEPISPDTSYLELETKEKNNYRLISIINTTASILINDLNKEEKLFMHNFTYIFTTYISQNPITDFEKEIPLLIYNFEDFINKQTKHDDNIAEKSIIIFTFVHDLIENINKELHTNIHLIPYDRQTNLFPGDILPEREKIPHVEKAFFAIEELDIIYNFIEDHRDTLENILAGYGTHIDMVLENILENIAYHEPLNEDITLPFLSVLHQIIKSYQEYPETSPPNITQEEIQTLNEILLVPMLCYLGEEK